MPNTHLGTQEDERSMRAGVFTRGARWYLNRSPLARAITRSLSISLTAAGASYLSIVLAESTDLGVTWRVVWTVAILGLVVFIVLVHVLVSESLEQVRRADEAALEDAAAEVRSKELFLGSARSFADEAMLAEILWLTNGYRGCLTVPADPLRTIRHLVRSAFKTLDSTYGQILGIGRHVEFQVSFMTKSYIDGGITIPASSDRHGRQPKSMNERPGNPGRYDSTVTAEVYGDEHHGERIVEDTHDPEWSKNYKLYPGQRSTIRSAVVWPILSGHDELLGTLVAHCDVPRFFRHCEHDHWKEFFEIFAKRIARAKLQLDSCFEHEPREELAHRTALPF